MEPFSLYIDDKLVAICKKRDNKLELSYDTDSNIKVKYREFEFSIFDDETEMERTVTPFGERHGWYRRYTRILKIGENEYVRILVVTLRYVEEMTGTVISGSIRKHK